MRIGQDTETLFVFFAFSFNRQFPERKTIGSLKKPVKITLMKLRIEWVPGRNRSVDFESFHALLINIQMVFESLFFRYPAIRYRMLC